jgi:hypothetical protein
MQDNASWFGKYTIGCFASSDILSPVFDVQTVFVRDLVILFAFVYFSHKDREAITVKLATLRAMRGAATLNIMTLGVMTKLQHSE